jgi:hypothetical protein
MLRHELAIVVVSPCGTEISPRAWHTDICDG